MKTLFLAVAIVLTSYSFDTQIHIYRVLLLGLKKIRMVKSLLLRYPHPLKESPIKIFHCLSIFFLYIPLRQFCPIFSM